MRRRPLSLILNRHPRLQFVLILTGCALFALARFQLVPVPVVIAVAMVVVVAEFLILRHIFRAVVAQEDRDWDQARTQASMKRGREERPSS